MTIAYIIGGLLMLVIVLVMISRSRGEPVDPMERLTKEELMKINQVVRPSSTPVDTTKVDEC